MKELKKDGLLQELKGWGAHMLEGTMEVFRLKQDLQKDVHS